MEKLMSKFNIKDEVKKGISIYTVKCRSCKHDNEIEVINKLNYKKLTTFKCYNCGNIYQIGDIYNFTTHKKLNERLDDRFNSEIYDKHEWFNNNGDVN